MRAGFSRRRPMAHSRFQSPSRQTPSSPASWSRPSRLLYQQDLVFVDRGAVRPFNSEDVVALAQPVSREGKAASLFGKSRDFASYGDDHPLFLNHCVIDLGSALASGPLAFGCPSLEIATWIEPPRAITGLSRKVAESRPPSISARSEGKP